MSTRNYIQHINRTRSINTITKSRNTHAHTQTQISITNNYDEDNNGRNGSYKNLMVLQQCQNRMKENNNNEEDKLSKMEMISISSLSGEKITTHAKGNLSSVEREHCEDQLEGNTGEEEYEWANQTFGDNVYQNISNYTTKQQKEFKQKNETKKLQQIPSHLQNISNTKLTSQMKIKINIKPEKNTHQNKTIIQNQKKIQLYKKNKNQSMSTKQIINNPNNLEHKNTGILLYSQKKKIKPLNNLANNTNTINEKIMKIKQLSKNKNFHDTVSISKQYNSKSITKSHHSSIINNVYSTNNKKNQPEKYLKKTNPHNPKNGRNEYIKWKVELNKNAKNNQVITLNSSILFLKDEQDDSFQQQNKLQNIYEQIKTILNTAREKQKQWQSQKNIYESRIKQLELELTKLAKKSNPTHHDYENYHEKQFKHIKNYQIHHSLHEDFTSKNSNRYKYINEIQKLKLN